MIRSFRHKTLRELYWTGKSAGVQPSLQKRCLARLDAMARSSVLEQLNLPGVRFHKLRGTPVRYSMHVNGPWCITFGWDEVTGEAFDIDLVNYH